MKIAIIGAGWYGCHIATYLRELGFDPHIFERGDRVFSGASGHNQNRLHQGFHYARDHKTRIQSRDGFARFQERYPALSLPVAQNLYVIAREESLIDPRTYTSIMSASGIDFDILAPNTAAAFGVQNAAGLIKVSERVVLTTKAASYFAISLKDCLRLNTNIRARDIVQKPDGILVNSEGFDFLVDTTWGRLFRPAAKVIFEPTLLLYYKTALPNWAITVVDGDLCSIYPTDQTGIVTLSSVPHTPLGCFESAREAENFLQSPPRSRIARQRRLMEDQIRTYVANFDQNFKYLTPQLSLKMKPVGREDSRACSVTRDDRIFSVMSGKIDTIFIAAEQIVEEIGALSLAA